MASKSVASEVEKLAKLIAGLGTAAEAKAKYETQIKEINSGFESFLKSNTAIVEKYAKLVEVLEEKIANLEEAATKG
jgi:hypothetical protein